MELSYVPRASYRLTYGGGMARLDRIGIEIYIMRRSGREWAIEMQKGERYLPTYLPLPTDP
ncbi:uncharacterized protein RSE6_08677 [Rhynchosporium secalis]|uniref:Uncharacterized protein n=1 Tax=Rhynchosporium secalis TaxID=38038 RepID=A0A1E1MG05_RHYSE|nr:uncharacterized protein RSE6_08677 [Rhynchosporium secalis]